MKDLVKLKSKEEIKKIISDLRKEKKTIVFTNGCFDLLHPGHIKILKEAKAKGDVLIVGLNFDSSIKKLKGRFRPILDQKARLQVLSAISYVDYIILFNELTPFKLIKIIKPDYLVKGSDYKEKEIVGREYSKKVIRVSLYKGYSTSKIIEKIKNEGNIKSN